MKLAFVKMASTAENVWAKSQEIRCWWEKKPWGFSCFLGLFSEIPSDTHLMSECCGKKDKGKKMAVGHATTFNLVGKPGCFARRVSLPPALPSTLTASGWVEGKGFSLCLVIGPHTSKRLETRGMRARPLPTSPFSRRRQPRLFLLSLFLFFFFHSTHAQCCHFALI